MTTNHPAWTIVAIVIYFALMLFIGYRAYRRTSDLDDYMLGSRNLPPLVAALSAGAADMSGWLLMGLPGALYLTGLAEAWIAIGLTIGAWCNWKFVAPRLRAYTEVARNAITIPSFFGNRLHDGSNALRITSGLIILVYFTFYVSSGMVSGGTFFEATFGVSGLWGIAIVGAVTVGYTFFGGFLGATWTDAVQGILMLIALLLVPVIVVIQMGGIGEVVSAIESVDAAGGTNHFSFVRGVGFLAIVSAAAWGLGYFGQPHIIVRFMALRSPQEAKAGRRWGIGWMALSMGGAVVAGLIGVAYYADSPLADPETVFLALAQAVFHPLIAGFVLTAVLAAIMSTMSSQLVVCSSAIVEDLFKLTGRTLSARQGVIAGRLGVLVVAIVAALLSLTASDTILQLVAFAWAGFGASFGPVILLSLYWRRLTRWGALAGMAVGAVTVFAWNKIFDLSGVLYEIVPGFAANLLVAIVVSLLTPAPGPEIAEEFEETKRRVRAAR
ncbi:MAG: sodium/proline symporter PutP [Propionibacteriaceae bacterium]|jgi:sodium/proline symporter|nr:sodium/proline symporter PutP [Propionibacteriaceae bacterium]